MRGIPQIAAILVVASGLCVAQQWNWVSSPMCARLKLKGGKISNRHFTIYAAQTESSKCCSGSPVGAGEIVGKTNEFKIAELEDGLYFAVFEVDGGQLVVPLEIKRQGRSGSGCGSESTVIEANRKTGKISVQTYIQVD